MATPVSAARKKSERSDDFMLPLGPTGEWREAEETAKPRNIWKKMLGKNVLFIPSFQQTRTDFVQGPAALTKLPK